MQFSLFPWDRNRPRRNPPLADCVVSVGDKTFGLRAQNGILFFRDQSELSKTWAIATPLSGEIENDISKFESFFRREYERGAVARYVVHLSSPLDRTVPLFFRANGSGFCRESWNRDDLPFSHSVSMHVWMEGDDALLTRDLDDVEAQLWAQLDGWSGPLLMDGNADEFEWMCGSKEELQRVGSWICVLEPALWKPATDSVEITVEAENSFSRAHISSIEARAHDGVLSHGVYLHVNAESDSDELRTWGSQHEVALSNRFWRLFDLALDQNTPAGLYWEYRDYGQNRAANEPLSPDFQLSYELPADARVSRIHARTELREWLRELVPASEIEDIMNDDAPRNLSVKKWGRA